GDSQAPPVTTTTLGPTSTSTTIAASTTSTTTVGPGTTSTTIVVGPGCGNGVIDTGEQCDGQNFGNATCPGGSPGAAFLICTSSCTIDYSNCPEICGDCIDNNQNGLTDFEDPACCSGTQQFAMSITKGQMHPAKGKSFLRIHSRLATPSGLAGVNPLEEDVFLQIRDPNGGELLCAVAPASHFMKMMHMHRAFSFWDKEHKVPEAKGVQDMTVTVKKNGTVKYVAFGKKVQF